MIRYALRCKQNHDFESWFQSSDAFDKLSSRGLVVCTHCGSSDVAKAIMAPSVTAGPPASAPKPEGSPSASALEKKLRALRKDVEENYAYVGDDFVRQARDMHLGDAPARPIWGEATPDEARALLEDGAPVAPLPVRPKQKSN